MKQGRHASLLLAALAVFVPVVVQAAPADEPFLASARAQLGSAFEVVSIREATARLGVTTKGKLDLGAAQAVGVLRLKALAPGCYTLRWHSLTDGPEKVTPAPKTLAEIAKYKWSSAPFALPAGATKGWTARWCVHPAGTPLPVAALDQRWVPTELAVGDFLDLPVPAGARLQMLAPTKSPATAPDADEGPACTIQPVPKVPDGVGDVGFECQSVITDVQLSALKLPPEEKKLGLFARMSPTAFAHGTLQKPMKTPLWTVLAKGEPRVLASPVDEGDGSQPSLWRSIKPVGLSPAWAVGDRVWFDVAVTMTQGQMQRCALKQDCEASGR